MNINKVFIELDRPILYYTIDIFEKSSCIDSIIVVARENEVGQCSKIASGFQKVINIVPGGDTRQQSSYNGVLSAKGHDIVVLHDGARPFIDEAIIAKSVKEAEQCGGSVTAVPEKNTIKQINHAGFIHTTLDREKLWSIQTPQTFQYEIIWNAHMWAMDNNLRDAVDDALLVERATPSTKIKIIKGTNYNIKITTKDDLIVARGIIRKAVNKNCGLRVGFGVDSHRFDTSNKELILGGVKIPGCPGLRANSDGDVIFHALFNALSQAIGMGSIGLYADKMCLSQGINDSAQYLLFISAEMTKKHYHIANVGIMIEAKKPRIEPFIDDMRKRISKILTIQEDQIGICATSGEELDAFGKGRGIKCSCTVCLYLDSGI